MNIYYQDKYCTLVYGKCLDVMSEFQDKMFDSVMCDLPFSITRNKWDVIIPFEPLWEQYKRVTKDKSPILLHTDGIFTGMCMMSNPEWYKYDIVWDKVSTTGFLNSKIMPMRRHEHVLVFGKGKIRYNPQMEERGKPRNKGAYHKADDNNCYGEYKNLVSKNNLYYPTSIFQFSNANQKDKLHPTQKPLTLLEYLIKTYTNEGDTILDNCCGSGTTLVAAKRLKRKCWGIEMEEKYCEITKQRLMKEDERLI